MHAVTNGCGISLLHTDVNRFGSVLLEQRNMHSTIQTRVFRCILYIHLYIWSVYIYIHMGDRWHNYKYIATNSLLRMHSTMRGQPRLQTWSFFARTTATTAAFGIARTTASFSSTCAGYTRTTATWKHYFFSARTTAADAYKCQLSRTTAVFQAIILYVGEYIMQQDVWHHNSTAA
jgi:hypothetical protein